MAVNSLGITSYGTQNKDTLNTILAGVVENVQRRSVAEAIKNLQGSGNPKAGSVEYKRFKNATLNNKGTARTAGKGSDIEASTVTVNLNVNKEIVEELQEKDIQLYGIEGMAEKRMENFSNRLVAELDKAFFAEAKTEGTAYSGNANTEIGKVDGIIAQAQKVSSDFIDGIELEDLVLVVDPEYRRAIKQYLDKCPVGTDGKTAMIGMYDGVETYTSTKLGNGVHAVCMLKGAIAEPRVISEYKMEKINLDDAFALENFLYYGVKALTPEAIIYVADSISA